MRHRTGRWTVLGVGVVVAGVLAGAVVAGRIDDGRELVDAIDEAPLQRVADIPAADGSPGQGVFVQMTRTGHLCVWEAPSATSRERGGGCNTGDDPLNGRPVSFTLSYDGGPAMSDVKSASLFGLTTAEVQRANVLMSDGTSHELKLKSAKVGAGEFKAFGYRFRKAELKRGIGPTAVIAIDASGVEIDRQTTGIGG